MNKILQSTLKTLNRTDYILSLLNDELLGDVSVPPYKSSIGSHIRHILDFYNCILNLNSENRIDLTLRKRDLLVESDCYAALQYCSQIKNRLMQTDYDFEKHVYVVDDLGMGKIEINYTLGALFAQANSHTIHHYAIINYIMEGLKMPVKDSDFGYNPTTPKPGALN